ncbi:MAG: PLP-dependent aminotransferase family protein [Desulfobacterales bacterium]|nr:PLP-dependent aminotransferase family protein [Desulfobacterales bacterium]MCP4163545.1 PLP-dependent aminotransferase family protein [Deltaproteobacteria bacterium]
MIDIKIDRDGGIPLYVQIRDEIINAVENGDLKGGDRLPAVTSFAKTLGVTACTVRRAFEDLTKDGLAHCHVGRGTFINETDKVQPEKTVKIPKSVDRSKSYSFNSLIKLIEKDGLIRFTSGGLSHNLTKKGVFDKVVTETLKANDQSKFQIGVPQGKIELRETISDRFKSRGHNIDPDQILITGGTQQAVFLMAHRAFLRDHKVLFETPWFSGMANAFKAFNHLIHTVPRDLKGPVPENYTGFPIEPTTFYVCPIYNNPMGTNMHPDRSKALIDWTRKNGGKILSDEVYYELYFDKPADSFLSEVNGGNVAVSGSMSKSFMFGMRLGWIVGSKDLIDELLPLKRTIDMGVPTLIQNVANTLIKSGEYDSNLEILRGHYKNVRDATLDALTRFMPDEVKWTKPEGGFHIWVELPENYSSVDTFLTAIDNGVAMVPGPLLDPDNGYDNAFKLSYGSIDLKDVDKGIKALANAVKKTLLSKPCAAGICSDNTDFR